MRGTTERDRIEELARVLDGDLPRDEAGAHVRSLARLAGTLHDEIPLERPDPLFRAALREQVVAAATATPPPLLTRVRDAVTEGTSRLRHSARAATAAATASMLLGSAGVAAAAQSALPGEALYGVKSATESLRLAFAAGDEQIGRLHLAFAEERLDEIVHGLDRLTPAEVVATLERMDASSETGVDELLQAFREEPSARLLRELLRFSDRQRSLLTEVVDRLPLEARATARESLALLHRIDLAIESSAAACDCGLTVTPAGVVSTLGAASVPVGDGDSTTLPLVTTREPRPPSGSLTDLGSALTDGLGGTTTATDDGRSGSAATGESILEGPSELASTVEASPTETVEELVDDTTDVVDDTTDGATETASEVVDGTTEAATEVIDEATEAATDLVDDGASEVGGILP